MTGRELGIRNEGNQDAIVEANLRYAHEARIVPNPAGLENEDGVDLIGPARLKPWSTQKLMSQ